LRQNFVRPGVLLRAAVTHQERLFLQYIVHVMLIIQSC
jgi:hypothetical protein